MWHWFGKQVAGGYWQDPEKVVSENLKGLDEGVKEAWRASKEDVKEGLEERKENIIGS